MDKDGDRRKSIVNGYHMTDMQHKMDSEYQAYLRQQERVREQAEHAREKQAASKRTVDPLTTFYSTRSYSKPWQRGMTTKTQIPGRTGLEDQQNRERHYNSSVSKLPAIKKDKELLWKKTVSNPCATQKTQKSITVYQPRIMVEKKKVHVRQLSATLDVGAEATRRGGNVLKWQSKMKEPKRPIEHQKQIFKEKEVTHRLHNGTVHPYSEREKFPICDTNHNDQVLIPASTSLPELREEPQPIPSPANSRMSPLPADVFNGQLERTIESNEGDNTSDEEDLSPDSDDLRQPLLLFSPRFYNTLPHQPNIMELNFPDSSVEESSDSENDEHPSIPRQDHEVNTEMLGSTVNGLDTTTRTNSSLRRPNPAPLLTSPRNWPGIRPTVSQVADLSPASLLNLREVTERQRVGAAQTTTPALELNRAPMLIAMETTLPQIQDINPNNINVQSQEYHTLPLTAPRASVGRERRLSGSEASSVPYFAPLELSLSSTAPSIAILRENLGPVLHILSMQRPSDRRNLESIVSTAQSKEVVKQADQEKLKKLQERLLEEDSEEEGDLCRICLMGGETTDNHLISPCQCTGSLKYVHTECMKKWLLAKINSGAELSVVKTCEMCKQKLECDMEGFNVGEHYRRHQETQATLNPSLYLVLLLHLYQQRYEELLQLTNTRDRVSEISRRFSNLSSGRREQSRGDDQDS